MKGRLDRREGKHNIKGEEMGLSQKQGEGESNKNKNIKYNNKGEKKTIEIMKMIPS